MDSPPGSLDPTEDAHLVERCLAGDGRAWEALVRRHERLVYAVARRYRLSEPDLGDVFQDVFTALVKGLPRLRDGRALCRWLVSTTDRIARTTALRGRRESARTVQNPAVAENIAEDSPAIVATLETLEEQALIRLALSSLPTGCRRLLIALYYEDPTPAYSQLARRWGVPIGSLGPTRARCIERLRRILKGLTASGDRISAEGSPTFADERSREERTDREVRGAALASEHRMITNTEESR
jgi:RNA polymerase sigma factor (sigma-70 family)